MQCKKCGSELPDNAAFCSECGAKMKKDKNIYLALILTFFITGLGTAYAGNIKKGAILFGLRILFILLGGLSNIFLVISILIWAFGFYECYRDIQKANGNDNPRLLKDFKNWNSNTKVISLIIILVILLLTVGSCVGLLTYNGFTSDDSNTYYYTSDSGSGGSSSSSSHYGGVDDSPWKIAHDDPDWYYDHYDYGDNDEIDEYLESDGYE